MRRILVIKNVGLWIALNRHFSSVSSVDLVETPTFETGKILAQVERPDVVVCSSGSATGETIELLQELRERGLDAIKIVLVEDRGTEKAPPPSSSDPGLVVCNQDDLVEVVSGLLDLSDETKESAPFELLSHYEILTNPSGEPRRGFAILLELDERKILLESDYPLETSDVMLLNFFLNEAEESTEREKVTLTCEIRLCRDEAKLVYTAAVSTIDEDSRLALRRLSSRNAGRA